MPSPLEAFGAAFLQAFTDARARRQEQERYDEAKRRYEIGLRREDLATWAPEGPGTDAFRSAFGLGQGARVPLSTFYAWGAKEAERKRELEEGARFGDALSSLYGGGATTPRVPAPPAPAFVPEVNLPQGAPAWARPPVPAPGGQVPPQALPAPAPAALPPPSSSSSALGIAPEALAKIRLLPPELQEKVLRAAIELRLADQQGRAAELSYEDALARRQAPEAFTEAMRLMTTPSVTPPATLVGDAESPAFRVQPHPRPATMREALAQMQGKYPAAAIMAAAPDLGKIEDAEATRRLRESQAEAAKSLAEQRDLRVPITDPLTGETFQAPWSPGLAKEMYVQGTPAYKARVELARANARLAQVREKAIPRDVAVRELRAKIARLRGEAQNELARAQMNYYAGLLNVMGAKQYASALDLNNDVARLNLQAAQWGLEPPFPNGVDLTPLMPGESSPIQPLPPAGGVPVLPGRGEMPNTPPPMPPGWGQLPGAGKTGRRPSIPPPAPPGRKKPTPKEATAPSTLESLIRAHFQTEDEWTKAHTLKDMPVPPTPKDRVVTWEGRRYVLKDGSQMSRIQEFQRMARAAEPKERRTMTRLVRKATTAAGSTGAPPAATAAAVLQKQFGDREKVRQGMAGDGFSFGGVALGAPLKKVLGSVVGRKMKGVTLNWGTLRNFAYRWYAEAADGTRTPSEIEQYVMDKAAAFVKTVPRGLGARVLDAIGAVGASGAGLR
jgi:hypothetical protein